MTAITVRAIYHNGWLKPVARLDLPEGTLIQGQIWPLLAASVPTSSTFGSLEGIWSHLTETEVEQVEQLLVESRDRSAAKIQQLADDLKHALSASHA